MRPLVRRGMAHRTTSGVNMTATGTPTLAKTLGVFQLWGIAVGLVISGEYFGWSFGWLQAGTLGFLVTMILVAILYIAFIFSFTELTTAIPQAGGPFAYAHRAFGPVGGAIAGFATLIEFLFAPPAIALAIGAYLAVQFPGLDPKTAAVGAYGLFVALNVIGVRIAATFELVVSLLAVGELLVFMGVVAPAFSWEAFAAGGWAGRRISASRRSAGCSPRSRSRSGSSSRSRVSRWQRKRRVIRSARSRSPISAAY